MRSSFFGGKNGSGSHGDRYGTEPRPVFDVLNQVRAYWEGLREDGALPLRSQIDPRGIEGALTSSFLLERVGPGIARFRIAGTQLSELIGMDVRGMPLTACFEPSARDPLMQVTEQVFSGPARLEMDLEAERGIGRPALEARLLLLPLRNEKDQVNLILGCLATSGEIGRAPRRFYIAHRHLSPVTTQMQGPNLVEHAAKHVAEFAEPATGFIPQKAKPGRSHLRLVKFDR
jgi:hypothetical protein